MPRKTTERDLYQEVTDTIVAAIETDPGRWSRPWVNGGAAGRGCTTGLPFNATTGATYRGINVLLLWHRAAAAGHATNQWASYRQWQKRGAQVRHGERGSIVVFYRVIERKAANGDIDRIPVLRHSRVFNADQVDGWQAPTVAEPPPIAERIEAADDFVANTGAEIDHGGNRACYATAIDRITMPFQRQFRDDDHGTALEHYYSTLLHELTHWSGHRSRCDRDLGNRFGTKAYAMEELVAELGAAFLCAELRIGGAPRQDHAQYLAHWLEVLKADKRAIFTAAAKASEAAGYLDGLQYDGDPDGEPIALPASPIALPAPVPVGAYTAALAADDAVLRPRGKRRTAITEPEMRKAMLPAPVYEGRFADGTTRRLSFYSAIGKPLDVARGRRVAALIGGDLVGGQVHAGGQAVADPYFAAAIAAA